jgi:hypothetical protein
MASTQNLDEARSEAEIILSLSADHLTNLFFRETMRRNLSRTVRHLDRLVSAGGQDRDLGMKALERLGFAPEA